MKKVIPDLKFLFSYIANVCVYSIFVALIIAGVLFASYLIDAKVLHTGQNPLFSAYIIGSSSMEPLISKGDAIICFRKDEENIQVGDVITYYATDPSYEDIMITHRVVDIYEEQGKKYYVPKGDNNYSSDRSDVTYDQIYGEVIMKIPKIGWIQYFLSTYYGWIIAIVLPGLIIIVSDIVKLNKDIKDANRRERRRGYADE